MIFDGTPENDNLIGTEGNDTITGLDGDDLLNGGLGDDSIEGGLGNDIITFGAGAKFVNGGEGEDVLALDFSGEADDFTLVYNSTDGGVTSEGILNGTRIEGIEQLNVASGSGNDNINISGASIGSVVSTNAGNDNIIGGQGDDELDGGAGDDTVIGGLGDDTIFGGVGTDILNGESGDDLIAFGAGAKTVNGGGGSDRLYLDYSDQTEDFVFTYNEFEGPSTTTGGILDGTEIESIERVDLFSGAGNDLVDIATASVGSVLAGGAGDDALIGGTGDDTINAEAGNDTFFGGAGNDVLSGGDGNDAAVFQGLGSDYQVVIGETAITVTGGPSPETEPVEPDAEPVETPVESFTDILSSDIEVILFGNGGINTATGEFTAFEPTDPPANAPSITIGTDADLVIPEPTPEPDIEDGETTDADIDGIPVFEFLRTDTETQFYTTEERERDSILETLPQYELEGISFVGAEPPAEGEDITGLSPVYRFFNTITGVHLYTADERERTFVDDNLDNFVFEGTPYYGFDAQEEGTVPLYRFYNESLGAHFYTASEEERASFVESPDFEPEGGDGIAFYVEPAPLM